MSKNIRNLTCLIFSLGLILSLAVCGNAASGTESNSSSAPSEQPGSQAAAADDKTTTEQMNEPIANDTVFRPGAAFMLKRTPKQYDFCHLMKNDG